MYIFTDPKVVECLYRVINVFGKLGEHINLVASPSSLEFSVVNSSLTVLGKAGFSTPLFSGPGATKNIHIKARAADFVLKRLENEEVSSLQLRFQLTRTGQEQLEIQFDYGNGIKKVFRISCLQTAILPMDFEPVGPRACSLECLPNVLKDAFASCEAGADELKLSFQHNLVNLLARKRGRVKNDSSILRSGLRTIINLQPETFRQITVRIPRQLEFKLKEFRVMLAFFDQLGEEIPIVARFNEGATTPLVFRAGLAAFPGMEFSFKFMAKVSIPRVGNEPTPPFLKVGPQPGWIFESGEESGGNALRHNDPALRHARQERDRRLRRIAVASNVNESRAQLSSPSPSMSDNNTGPQEPDNSGDDFDPTATEIGFTQGSAPTPIRGLFD